MLEWAYAPSVASPPELYVRYTWVKELGLSWADVGGPPSIEEIGLLAELVNMKVEAENLKARVGAAGQSGGATIG